MITWLFNTKWKKARDFENFALCTAPLWLDDDKKRMKVFERISKNNGIKLDVNDTKTFENMFNMMFAGFYDDLKVASQNSNKVKM